MDKLPDYFSAQRPRRMENQRGLNKSAMQQKNYTAIKQPVLVHKLS